ncbi:hypothetical protein VHA_001389 [Grimontia hollisae CIP 101886]|uniref:Uncharacterized protein n=1 Tax=Grimontia hollisae CIP 101886 TaxID=675812 RepID=D0I6M2_GRIHO|nr:hypothetical protein VHA_001389 [Grimontia hollisae CIP 101886]
MQIADTFRDLKSRVYGVGLRQSRTAVRSDPTSCGRPV